MVTRISASSTCMALALTGWGILPAFPAAMAASAETPETFVRRVYARYRADGPDVPTSRPGGEAYYAPALLDAIAEDERLAHGEVGTLDGDPLCACQDHGTLQVRKVVIVRKGVDQADARVTFRNFGRVSTVRLTLVKLSTGWRIADVGDENTRSVAAMLHDAVAHPIRDPAPSKP